MKRILAVLLAVLIPLLLLVSVAYALYRPGAPPEAQAVLDQFLAWKGRRQPGIVVTGLQPAPWPEQLRAQTAGAAFSTDPYFCTSFGADDPSLRLAAVLTGTQVSELGGEACTGRALPYPAHAAWCATLAKQGAPQAERQTVIVARHDDLYVARWIVHMPADASAICAVCGCPAR